MNEQGLRTYEGAVAIITGGASGIGRALGEALSHRGAEVILADRQIDLAEKVAADIREDGGMATAAEVNVTDFPAMNKLVQTTLSTHGRLDYFFNNAGIGIGGEVSDYRIEDWYQVLDVNLRGVVHGVQAAYPVMLRQGYGHLVNTASMAGLIPAPSTVSYATSKWAVVGLSVSLRVEAAPAGVRVSVLCPGVIRTPILEGGGKYGKMLRPLPKDVQLGLWEKLKPMAVDRFAEKVLQAVAKNKPIIVVPWQWKLSWWMMRLSPSVGISIAGKFHRRNREILDAAHAASQPREASHRPVA